MENSDKEVTLSKTVEENTDFKESETEEKETEKTEENKEEKKEDKKEEKKLKTSDKVFFAVMGSLIAILLTYLILFNTVFFHVQVSGRSMQNTFSSTDIVIANKHKTPKYGDVIIVSGLKDSGEWLIKRAIAFEGDIVTIVDGDVYLNGTLLEEDYAVGKTYAPDCRDDSNTNEMIYLIEEGEIFFLGDNREDSLDSRFYGVCTFDNIEGVIGKGAIKMKGFTTSINTFFMKIKLALGLKTGLKNG